MASLQSPVAHGQAQDPTQAQVQQHLPQRQEIALNLPTYVDEDHCLHRHPGLPKIKTAVGQVKSESIICYNYSVGPKRKWGKSKKKSADATGEAYVSHPLSDFWVAKGQEELAEEKKLEEGDFPDGTEDRLRVIQLPRCSIPLAKAVIRSLAHGIKSKDENKPYQNGSNQGGNVTAAGGGNPGTTPGHEHVPLDAQTSANYWADGVDPTTRHQEYYGQASQGLNVGGPHSGYAVTAHHSVVSTEEPSSSTASQDPRPSVSTQQTNAHSTTPSSHRHSAATYNSTIAPFTTNATCPATPDPETPSPRRTSFEDDWDYDTDVEEEYLPTPEPNPPTLEPNLLRKEPAVADQATKVVASPNITNRLISGFLTGISLQACYESETGPHLSLFVAVPYLSESSDGGKTLAEYNGSTSSASEGSNMFVHQAWFYVPNNKTIAVFKSHGINEAPLFPCQEREGAYHALSQMILATFSTTFSRGTLHKSSHLPSALAVILDQIKVLEDLTHLYQDNLSPKNGGCLPLPVLSEQEEQVSCALKTMEKMMAERKAEAARLEMIMGGNIGEVQRAEANRRETGKLAEMMEKQGETISVFTLITAMFLPLNFLATFFGMNPPNWKGIVSTAWQFWAISGPITLIVTVAMGVFLFHDDRRMKDRLRKWLRINRDGAKNESSHSESSGAIMGGNV